MKKYIILFLLLVLTVTGTLLCIGREDDGETKKAVETKTKVQKETDKKVSKELDEIRAIEDSNKIAKVNIPQTPYFLKKQEGYKYEKTIDFKYYSTVLNKERTTHILLPKNFDKNKEYPFLIVLHGLKGSKNTWLNKNADIIIQNLYYFENTPEMITVFVDSNLNDSEDLSGLSFVDNVKYFNKTKKEVMEGVIPALRKQYKLKKGSENGAIVGQSLGGRNATLIGINHPETFGYIGALGPAKLLRDGNTHFDGFFDTFAGKLSDTNKMFFVCLGNSDTTVGEDVKRLEARLVKDNVKHIYTMFNGAHNDETWQAGFYNFVRNIFK